MQSKFYKGQKIIAIKSHSLGLFKKGDEFKVLSIVNPCCDVMLQIFNNTKKGVKCSFCGSKHDDLKGYFSQTLFAPLQEMSKMTFEEAINVVNNDMLLH